MCVMGELTRGMGRDSVSLERRIAFIERFLTGLSKWRVVVFGLNGGRRKIEVLGTAGSEGSVDLPPFGLVLDEGKTLTLTVSNGVLKRADTGTAITVTGLDPKTFTVKVDDIAYLEVAVNADMTLGTAEVKAGGKWAGWPKPAAFSAASPFPQTKAFLQLGSIAKNGTDTLVDGPWSSGNMVLVQAVVDGRLAWFIQPGN